MKGAFQRHVCVMKTPANVINGEKYWNRSSSYWHVFNLMFVLEDQKPPEWLLKRHCFHFFSAVPNRFKYQFESWHSSSSIDTQVSSNIFNSTVKPHIHKIVRIGNLASLAIDPISRLSFIFFFIDKSEINPFYHTLLVCNHVNPATRHF